MNTRSNADKDVREGTMSRLSLVVTICLICVFGLTMVGTAAQTFTTLVSFDTTNGQAPEFGSLVQGFNGNFYGTTHYGGREGVGTVYEITSGGN